VLATKMKQFSAAGEKVTGNLVYLKDVGSVRFLCLPDTVDPRGPKGK
jgi:hypothetical protein